MPRCSSSAANKNGILDQRLISVESPSAQRMTFLIDADIVVVITHLEGGLSAVIKDHSG